MVGRKIEVWIHEWHKNDKLREETNVWLLRNVWESQVERRIKEKENFWMLREKGSRGGGTDGIIEKFMRDGRWWWLVVTMWEGVIEESRWNCVWTFVHGLIDWNGIWKRNQHQCWCCHIIATHTPRGKGWRIRMMQWVDESIQQRNGKGHVSWNVRESKCPYRLRSALFWFFN